MTLFWIRVPAAAASSERPFALTESTVVPPDPQVPTTSLAPPNSSPLLLKSAITRPDTVQLEPVTYRPSLNEPALAPIKVGRKIEPKVLIMSPLAPLMNTLLAVTVGNGLW